MNKPFIYAVTILLGSVLGCYIGIISGRSGSMVAMQIFNGAFFGYLVGWALFLRKYRAFIWSGISLIIVLITDWISGSQSVVYYALEFMIAGFFMGLDLWRFRKQVALLGIVGAVCGFIVGMNNVLRFETSHLDSGFLSAVLLAVKFSILGMGYGRLLLEIIGWRPRINDFE